MSHSNPRITVVFLNNSMFILGRALCVLPRAVTLKGGGGVETHIRPKRSDLPPISDVELGPCVALCVLHV